MVNSSYGSRIFFGLRFQRSGGRPYAEAGETTSSQSTLATTQCTGGSGEDHISDPLGANIVFAGPGHDVITVPPSGPVTILPIPESDAIFCGSGFDAVLAHQNDTVAADCELVRIVQTTF
jgi:hypothetical protein